MLNKYPYKSTFISLGAVLLSMCAVGIAENNPSSLPVQNPAIEKFNNDITFYTSFDSYAAPDLSNGKGTHSNKQTPTFAEGIWGQAVQGLSQPLLFEAKDNIDLTKPGSLSFWVKPQDWDHEEEPKYIHFIIADTRAIVLQVSRMGSAVNKERLYTYTKIGAKGTTDAQGSSKDWKDNWHLLAANWGKGYIEFSVDGGNFRRVSTPEKPQDAPKTGVMRIAGSGATPYLMDELFIFNRPLNNDEVQWIWQSKNKKGVE